MHERSDGAFTLVVQGRAARPTGRGGRGGGAPRRRARSAAGARAPSSRRARPWPTSRSRHRSRTRTPPSRRRSCARRSARCPGATTYLTGYPARSTTTRSRSTTRTSARASRSRSRSRSRHGLHVRHGRRDRRAARLRARDASPRRSASCGSSPIRWTWPIYVTNIVTLIGFAIAIDYSMLVVFRYREELAGQRTRRRRWSRRWRPPGARRCSRALTVAVGLALLSSCPCRSCARWGSAACSSRSSRSPPRRPSCRRCWR